MFLVELVMQGVRGFQQLVRLRFQGGFNFVAAGNETGKTTSVDSMVRLLFPANDPAKTGALLSRAQPEGSRGALVVYSDDGAYYRVIQDFSKNAINLSKYNAPTKEFTLQNKDWDSTAQFMESLRPGITEDEFDRLFVFRRDACSAGAAVVRPSAAARSTARMQPAAPAPVGRTRAEDAKLAEMKEALRKAEEAADAEYRAEAARVRLTDIAKKLERLEESRGRVSEIEAQLEQLKSCESLPENISELIQNHEQAETEKAAQLNDVEKDIEALTIQRDTMPTVNMWTDKLFIIGAGVGGLALIAGLFILSDEQAVFFPIGILAALFLMGAGWYNSSRKNAQRGAVQKEIDNLVKDRAAIEKKFKDAGATVLKFMQQTNSSSAGELKEKADNYRYFLSLVADNQEQQRMAAGGQQEEDLRAEYATQQEEVSQLEQAAKPLARYAVDTYSLRQEIERLEGEAASVQEAAPDRGFADFGGEEFTAPAVSGDIDALDPLSIAAKVSGIEMETLTPAVESAAQRNISTVSGGRYVRIEIGQDGLPLLHDASGSKHSFEGLSHGTALMACFCLRAAVVEAIAGKRRLPFLLDDPFGGLDAARQQAACQVLRMLGTKTQVILFSSNPALKAPTDTAVELK